MEINGHEIRADQVWKTRDGSAVIIAVTDDDFAPTVPIKCYTFISGDRAGAAFYRADGTICHADGDHDMDLIEPANAPYTPFTNQEDET